MNMTQTMMKALEDGPKTARELGRQPRRGLAIPPDQGARRASSVFQEAAACYWSPDWNNPYRPAEEHGGFGPVPPAQTIRLSHLAPDAKRRAWEMIKQNHPGHAEFLRGPGTALLKAFGGAAVFEEYEV